MHEYKRAGGKGVSMTRILEKGLANGDGDDYAAEGAIAAQQYANEHALPMGVLILRNLDKGSRDRPAPFVGRAILPRMNLFTLGRETPPFR